LDPSPKKVDVEASDKRDQLHPSIPFNTFNLHPSIPSPLIQIIQQPHSHTTPTQQLPTMNFFGGGRPQPSSAEKIAAAEAEIDMVSDMFNRYLPSLLDII
jgi:hypothetical protein